MPQYIKPSADDSVLEPDAMRGTEHYLTHSVLDPATGKQLDRVEVIDLEQGRRDAQRDALVNGAPMRISGPVSITVPDDGGAEPTGVRADLGPDIGVRVARETGEPITERSVATPRFVGDRGQPVPPSSSEMNPAETEVATPVEADTIATESNTPVE